MSPQTVSNTGISSIGQVAITVTDLERAIRFYRDALGLKLRHETSEMAFFDCGGMRLMLGSSAHGGEATYSSIVYYTAEDIQHTADLLTRRGVQFEAQPRVVAKMQDHDVWMAFFHDSEGNLAALISEVR